MSSPSSSPTIPLFALQLLELFDGPLRDVRFPEIDRATLAAALDEARAADDAVAQAEEALARARAERDDRQRALLTRAERGVAYARVYAEDQPDLRTALDNLAHRPSKRATTRSSEPGETPDVAAATRKPRQKRGAASDPLFELEGGDRQAAE